MFYLTDVRIFVVIVIALLALAWWNGRTPSMLQNTLIGIGVILGSWTLLLALLGFFIGFKYELPAFILFLIALIWPWKSTFTERWESLQLHAKHSLRFISSLRGVEAILGIYLFLIFALTFVLCLAPPSGNDYDALVYHLAAPMQYLMAGGIHVLQYDHHTFFPFTMEMLYLCGLQLSGPVLAKLFHWLMLPLSCLALVAMGNQLQSRRSGLWAAAIFVSLPLVLFEATTAYIDLALIFFSLLAFLCFFNWLEDHEIKWLTWCGIFCGFCLGIKYSGIFIAFFIGLWLLGTMAKRRQWQFAGIGIFIFWMIFTGGFWYAKNVALTNNPVFPFAYSIFGGKGWTKQMAVEYNTDQHEYGYGRKPLDWAMLPWRLSMAPLNDISVSNTGITLAPQPFWPFSGAVLTPQTGIANGRFEVIGLLTQSLFGPLLLALCIPLIFVRRKPRFVGFALWSFAFFFVLWAIGSQQLRYLLAPAALLCLAAGWMVDYSWNRSTFLKWTTTGAVAISCIFAPAYLSYQSRQTLPVILGQMTPDNYLSHSFAGYDAMRWANTNTPKDAVYAIYGEPRCFYLHKKYFWADDPHNNL
ncbi:MAG: phospholipid carrier-dependent glycosyltransferase, partial [Abditibacteriaceae bacterium]